MEAWLTSWLWNGGSEPAFRWTVTVAKAPTHPHPLTSLEPGLKVEQLDGGIGGGCNGSTVDDGWGRQPPFGMPLYPLEIENLTCSHHQVGPNNQSSDFKYHMTKYQNFCHQVKISDALIMLDGFPQNRFRNFLLGNKSWYFTWWVEPPWGTVWPNRIHTMRWESLYKKELKKVPDKEELS